MAQKNLEQIEREKEEYARQMWKAARPARLALIQELGGPSCYNCLYSGKINVEAFVYQCELHGDIRLCDNGTKSLNCRDYTPIN